MFETGYASFVNAAPMRGASSSRGAAEEGRTAGAAGIQRNCLTRVGAKFRMADVASLLNGAWKRNLQCRRFGGGFDLLRASNSVVVIEDAPEAAVPEPSLLQPVAMISISSRAGIRDNFVFNI